MVQPNGALQDDRFILCGCCLPPPPLPEVAPLEGLDAWVPRPRNYGEKMDQTLDLLMCSPQKNFEKWGDQTTTVIFFMIQAAKKLI